MKVPIEMKIPTLSFITKLGIVLSILWIIFAGKNTYDAITLHANNFADLSYKTCLKTNSLARTEQLKNCEQERSKSLAIWLDNRQSSTLAKALFPIPIFWLLGFIGIYIYKVIKTGVAHEIAWSTLSKPKKFFVSFCFFTLYIVFLTCSNTINTLYVASKVPVSLSPFVDVYNNNETPVSNNQNGIPSYVSVSGTFSATDEKSLFSEPLIEPIQTSKIDCYRDKGSCIEARASVFSNSLNVDLIEYEIVSWSANTVVFKSANYCGEDIFTIDLLTKSVNGISRSFINKGCDNKQRLWKYTLANGYDIVEKEKRKIQPWYVMAIKSLFSD